MDNILVSELTATLNRVKIIGDNISDPVTKQLSKDVMQYLTPLIDDIKQALDTIAKQNDNTNK